METKKRLIYLEDAITKIVDTPSAVAERVFAGEYGFVQNPGTILSDRQFEIIDRIVESPLVDVLELPNGRPGDYLEWDIGNCTSRFYFISAIIFDGSDVRYDLGDMTPTVDHRCILGVLTKEELSKKVSLGDVRIETGEIRFYRERK